MGYRGEDIEVLPFLEAVRRRPEMYAGPLGSPSTLSNLIEQVMCASLDEAISGRCTYIHVTLHSDDSVIVEDDGPGMSVETDSNGQSFVEKVMTSLAGCRAVRENAYAKSFCGLGMASVNALCETMQVEVRRAGHLFTQYYAAGKTLTPLVDQGPCATTGLRFHFKLDTTIFGVRQFDAVDLGARFDEIRRETKVDLQLVDERR